MVGKKLKMLTGIIAETIFAFCCDTLKFTCFRLVTLCGMKKVSFSQGVKGRPQKFSSFGKVRNQDQAGGRRGVGKESMAVTVIAESKEVIPAQEEDMENGDVGGEGHSHKFNGTGLIFYSFFNHVT